MAIAEDEVAVARSDEAREEETPRYERSPRDALRLAVFGVVTLLVLALALWLEDSVLGFEQSIIGFFDFLSPTVERVINGALQWFTAFVGISLLVVPLITKRYRLFWYLLLAAGVAALLMSGVVWLLEQHRSEVLLNQIAQRAGITRVRGGSLQGCAALLSEFVVLGPFVSKRWRHTGMIAAGVVVLLHFVVSAELPASLAVAVPLGATCGVAVLLALGRPDRRPTMAAIRSALIGSGLPVANLRVANVDARGSTPYFATLNGGGEVFVKVLGEDERAADLMYRTYRFLRLKDVGDYRPFSSLRRGVEHEALVSLFARDAGVRTPRMEGIVEVGLDSMLLAYEMIDGRSVDRMEPTEVTDELMTAIWGEVAILRSRRIAHRDLRRANVFVADDHQPWIIDFGFSELAVEDDILDADVAQLLASFVVVAGAERTVRVAIEAIGRDAVAEALPRLQINALSGATQTALKKQTGLLDELQKEVASQCGIEHIQFQELHRFNKQMLLTIVVVVAATYFLFPQFADLPKIIDQVKHASWGWLPLIVSMSVLTYVGAASSLGGAVPNRIAALPLFATQVGSSFASKLAPGGLGGMALNVRFLQKQGVDEPVAVTGVGLNSIGGFVAHTSLIVVFIFWAGRKAFGSFKLPDPHWFLIGAGIALVFIAIGAAIPFTRRLFLHSLLPILRRSVGGVNEVIHRPAKLALLLGGSVLVTSSYLVALYLSVEAFGGGLSFATVGAVYLVGSAVATAAPTPGGLGAMEAALIGGLVAAGLANPVAVPAVFLFRLATFWLPILPGWLCFTWLRRREYI